MNRISALTIFLVMFISAVASAQVDTLMLVEIGFIQAPSEITGLYVEDLDGDSLKEIIICTDYYVYIYNSQTYQVEWTSPPLNHPMDLLFEDINGNGLIDFSVKDSTNIHLFDPHTPQTIWISPVMDSTYMCYTIGDRNDDDWFDVIIVSKEWFNRIGDPDNLDTSFVDIYDGPAFSLDGGFIILMPNYRIPDMITTSHREYPIKTFINRIFSNNTLFTKILLYSYKGHSQSGHGGLSSSLVSGNLRLIDPVNFTQVNIEDVGTFLSQQIIESDGSLLLNLISKKTRVGETSMFSWDDRYKFHHLISADTVLSIDTIWYSVQSASFPHYARHIDWEGFIFDDFLGSNPGYEIVFGAQDSLYQLSILDNNYLWINANITNLRDIKYIYHSNIYPEDIKIICHIGDTLVGYKFFSGADGSLSAQFPDHGFNFSNISDLDNDSNDEILSIQDQSLGIYHFGYATDIDDDSKLPYRAILRPNYPNPFNSATTIEYGLPEAGRVRIDIYDLLGRKVETLVDEEMQPGRHRIVWDASGYSSGVYFYRIEAGDFVDTKRMVFLK